ncbi:unnamed protein product [Prorocentrum cordatum]|uniref:Cellulase n=1 Tax=Prorocentrum cordatum TaxID=2364126 RepID=A0ABN9UBW5_9DINO|nr:unnamed protein product [Polarella glacialis]
MAKQIVMKLTVVLCAALVSCVIGGDCDCMTEWTYDGDVDGVMESYEGCSATADWNQTWCYVQGGSNCNQALNSTVAGETRKWRECGSCNCMTEWNYDGDADGVMESYEGCSATADWDQSWCYVQGGSNCNQALNSTVAGETRKWRECGSCNCMTERVSGASAAPATA